MRHGISGKTRAKVVRVLTRELALAVMRRLEEEWRAGKKQCLLQWRKKKWWWRGKQVPRQWNRDLVPDRDSYRVFYLTMDFLLRRQYIVRDERGNVDVTNKGWQWYAGERLTRKGSRGKTAKARIETWAETLGEDHFWATLEVEWCLRAILTHGGDPPVLPWFRGGEEMTQLRNMALDGAKSWAKKVQAEEALERAKKVQRCHQKQIQRKRYKVFLKYKTNGGGKTSQAAARAAKELGVGVATIYRAIRAMRQAQADSPGEVI